MVVVVVRPWAGGYKLYRPAFPWSGQQDRLLCLRWLRLRLSIEAGPNEGRFALTLVLTNQLMNLNHTTVQTVNHTTANSGRTQLLVALPRTWHLPTT